MPTFDFRCRTCDHTFEFTRPFGSDAKPTCPACDSQKTEKLFSPPAVHFKGSGWYKTDARAAAAQTEKKPAEKKEEKEQTSEATAEPKKASQPTSAKDPMKPSGQSPHATGRSAGAS